MATPRLRQTPEPRNGAFRRLLDQATDPVFLLDRRGAVTYANQAATRLLGFSPAELFRHTPLAFVHPDDLSRAQDLLAVLLQHWERPVTAVVRCRHGDGEYLDVEVIAVNRLRDAEVGAIVAHAHDVTARERARSRLDRSEDGYRALVERLPVVAYTATLDEPSVLLYASPQIEALLGYTPDEFRRNDGIWPEGIHSEDRQRVLAELRACGRTGRPFVSEYRFVRRDGRVVWLRDVGTVVPGTTGRPLCLQGVMQDVTERKQAEEALRRTQQEFRDIFELASVGIFRASREGRILLANSAFARLLGYETPEELAALDLARDVYVNPDQRDALVSQYERAAGPWTIEVRWKKRDGTPFWVLLSGHALGDDVGRAVCFEAFVQDITERRRSQQELKRSRRRLQALAARLEEVREQERKVMAREIHDELGQGLTALRMDLAWLAGHLPAEARDLTARTHRMVEVVEQTIQTVRRLATQLRPPILDDLGLIAAVEWQAEDVARRLGLRCALDLPADLYLHEGLATTVFRILQEALTNVARHAGASSLRVALRVQDEQLLLEVVDDGRGIAPVHLKNRRSLGLLGMRERAMAWGGVLDIQSPPEGGTAVVLRLPLAGTSPQRDMP